MTIVDTLSHSVKRPEDVVITEVYEECRDVHENTNHTVLEDMRRHIVYRTSDVVVAEKKNVLEDTNYTEGRFCSIPNKSEYGCEEHVHVQD